MSEPAHRDLARRMAELARQVAAPTSIEVVLNRVTATVMELLAGADAAGVLLIKGGKFESHGITSELPHRLDMLQERFQEGPCYEAAVNDVIVRTDDFRTEPRWPRYSKAVVDIGVLSGLSFKLYTSARTAGALNVFSYRPHGSTQATRRSARFWPRMLLRRSWLAAATRICNLRSLHAT